MCHGRETDEFNIYMENGYLCEVTQISQSLPSGGNPGVNVDFDHILPDGKFTVVSLEKLRIVRGDDLLAEKFLTETVRFPGTYHLFSGNGDDEVFKAMDQLTCRLLCFTHIISHDACRQIVGEAMKFFQKSIAGTMQLNHRALWVSLTFELVKTEQYDEANDAHVLAVEQRHQPNGELRRPTCSVCGQVIPRNESFTHMPCGENSHDRCLWTWPRLE